MADRSFTCSRPTKHNGECDTSDFDSDSTYFEVNELSNLSDTGHEQNVASKSNISLCLPFKNENEGKLKQEMALKNDKRKSSHVDVRSSRSKITNADYQPQNDTSKSTVNKRKFKLDSEGVTIKPEKQFNIKDKSVWLQTVRTIYNNWMCGQEPLLERHEAETILNNIKEERIKCLNELVKYQDGNDTVALETYKLYKDMYKLEKDFQSEIDLCDMKHTKELEMLKERLESSNSTIEISSESDSEVTTVQNFSEVPKLFANDINKTTVCNKSTMTVSNVISRNGFEGISRPLNATKSSSVFSETHKSTCKDDTLTDSTYFSYNSCSKGCDILNSNKFNEMPYLKNKKKSIKFTTVSKSDQSNNIQCSPIYNANSVMNDNIDCTKYDTNKADFLIPFSLSNVNSRIIINSDDISEIEFRSMDISHAFQKMFDAD